MLIKPDLNDEVIVDCLQDAYGLKVEEVSFLPLGADFNTSVYRVSTCSKKDYFLKLRREALFAAAVVVPKYLADIGLKQVIPPLETQTGQLWTSLAQFIASLYPYIQGHNAVDVKLSDQQWIEFGATMKKFHSIDFPSTITKGIQRETYSSKWCVAVKTFLRRIEDEVFKETVAAKTALFLKAKSKEILNLVRRTEELASLLQKQSLEFILCHADIHGWNLLIDKKSALYVIDWDTLIFAPKERDLMFIGAGIGDSGRSALEEETLFYQGYGQTNINQAAIAYYRYACVIEDIGVYCEQIFLSDEGEVDRRQSLEYLQSHFLPDGTIARAYQLDKMS